MKSIELTIEELKALYGIFDDEVYVIDDVAKEIIKSRDIKKDLAKVFNCLEDEVEYTRYSADIFNNPKIKVWYGKLSCFKQQEINDFKFPEIFIGNLDLSWTIKASNVILPRVVYGGVDLRNLEDANSITPPEKVTGSYILNHIKKTSKNVLPTELYGDVFMNHLVDSTNIVFPPQTRKIYLNDLKTLLTLPESLTGRISTNAYLCYIPDSMYYENSKIKIKSRVK